MKLKSKAQTDMMRDANKWRLISHPRTRLICTANGHWKLMLDFANQENQHKDPLVGEGASLEQMMGQAMKNSRVRKLMVL